VARVTACLTVRVGGCVFSLRSRVVDDAYDTVHRLSEPNPVPSDWVLRNHGCVFPVPVAATAHPPCCARDYRKVFTAVKKCES
jgi:hypothetical protein